MKKVILYTTLSAFLFTTSCATILGSKTQKVNFKTDDASAEVYIQDSLIASGVNTETEISKQEEAIQVIVKKEGYESKYYGEFATRRSPWYIMSWIPFIVIAAPMFDDGYKGFKYNISNKMYAPSETKIKIKADDEKFILVNNVSFNLVKDSIKEYSQSFSNYKKSGGDHTLKRSIILNTYGKELNSEDITISNTIFTDILNEELKERSFVDTISKVLKNKTNTLYIDADVNYLSLTKLTAPINSGGEFFIGEVGIKWTVRDIYKTELFTFDDKVTTGEIVKPFVKKGEEDYFFKDVFNKSISNFLNTKEYIEVSKIITKGKEFEEYTLPNPKNVVEGKIGQALEATVTVETKDGHGSGFFINNEGYILTNHHVISGEKEEDIKIIMNNGEKYSAKILRSNDFDDVALLKIDHKNKISFDINTHKEGNVGDEIYAIGTPNAVELGQSLSQGIISGKRKNDNGQEYYQTDASVNGGNSGGAFVSKNGNILGIVNAKLVGIGVEGVGFAIKIERVVEALNLKFK
ncbi:MAG TPA: trypsin-like peptidase domain-containing protein [Brumimicrobium sp.]|nr:trypsin-like peptidase domain-containing protein [Brumimicrobium sp.]